MPWPSGHLAPAAISVQLMVGDVVGMVRDGPRLGLCQSRKASSEVPNIFCARELPELTPVIACRPRALDCAPTLCPVFISRCEERNAQARCLFLAVKNETHRPGVYFPVFGTAGIIFLIRFALAAL